MSFVDPKKNPQFQKAFQALEQAVRAQRSGQNEEADRLYAKVIKNNPDYFDALNLYGLFKYQTGQYQAAFDLLKRATRLYPRSANALNNLGIVLCHLKRIEEAVEAFDRALAIEPSNVNSLSNRGNALLDLNRAEAALASFDAAIKLQPQFFNGYINRGRALMQLERHQDALANYDVVLSFRPFDAEIHYNRGGVLYQLQRWEEALASFEKALALKPQAVEALAARGRVLVRLGRDVEAAHVLSGLVKLGGAQSIDALVALSSLPAYVSADLLPQIEKTLGAGFDDQTQLNKVGFVRAAALDKLGRHAEAWEGLTQANRQIFASRQAEAGAMVDRLRTTLDRLRSKSTATTGESNEHDVTSLFILGPSRTGKTGLERLVSVLPGVRRGYERPCAIDDAIRRTLEANGLPADTLLENVLPKIRELCREAYVDQEVRNRTTGGIVTNTLPGRIYTADLIAELFPNVRFLGFKRNVEDTILRIYQRTYDTGHAYAYDLKTARDYVVCYYQALDLLREKFPRLVRVASYEEMLADPAATLRMVAEFIGAPVPDGTLPPIADDRGCAAPYSRFIAAELAA